jgi:two-component system sensor histidine kinase UhpB
MKPGGPQLLTYSATIPAALGDVSAKPSARTRRTLRLLLTGLVVATAYYLGTLIGFRLTPPPGTTISSIWPPNAILFASLLLVPSRRWWLLLAMVFPAHLLAQLPTGVPLARSVGWFFTNSAEALIGAYCVLAFSKSRAKFFSVRGTVVFLIFGFLLAPLITSFLDAAVVVRTGWSPDYWTTWTRRLFSNMLSNLTIVPPLVILGQHRLSRLRKTPVGQYFELFLVLAGVFLLSRYIFGDTSALGDKAPALIYAPLPLLLWAAVRTGPGGLSASLLILAVVSIWESIHGRVPFPGVSVSENILYLQVSGSMVTVPMMLLAAVLSERRTTELELRDSKVKLIEAQEQERRRIASELHDDVGQQLALAELRLAEIKSASDLKPMLDRLSDQLAEISSEVREISHGLYPSLLQNLGLAPALKKLGREISREKNVSVKLALERVEFVSPAVSLALYRVAQEALHNIEKHSQARHVTIELSQTSGTLVLRITDDGIGFDAGQVPVAGLGIDSMGERLRSVGGTLRIKSSPNRGTEVLASVPLEQPRLELPQTGT